MAGEIANSAAIRFGGCAGRAEITDERFPFGHFLFFKSENAAYGGKGEGKAHVRRPNHRAAPAFGAEEGIPE